MLGAAGNDDSLLKNYNTMLSSHKSYGRPDRMGAPTFIVSHYAGDVIYDIEGFVEKNKDSVSKVIEEALKASKSQLIIELFKKEEDEG
jgi:myosin heavy subunit